MTKGKLQIKRAVAGSGQRSSMLRCERSFHGLAGLYGLADFVGLSFQSADYSMRYGQTESGPPSIVSTVKINGAGFTEMIDTEDMFRDAQWAPAFRPGGRGPRCLPA